METFSASLAICAGNSPVTGEFPAQKPVTQSFGVFFDLRLNIRLSKQWRGWWFEMPSRSSWRHCNVLLPHLLRKRWYSSLMPMYSSHFIHIWLFHNLMSEYIDYLQGYCIFCWRFKYFSIFVKKDYCDCIEMWLYVSISSINNKSTMGWVKV